MTVFIDKQGRHLNCDDGKHGVIDARRGRARDRARDTAGERDDRDDRDDDTVTMSAAELERMIAQAVREAFKKQLAGAEDDEPDAAEAGEQLARLGGATPSPGPLLSGRAGDRRARDSARRRAHDSAMPRDYDFAAIVQRPRY